MPGFFANWWPYWFGGLFLLLFFGWVRQSREERWSDLPPRKARDGGAAFLFALALVANNAPLAIGAAALYLGDRLLDVQQEIRDLRNERHVELHDV